MRAVKSFLLLIILFLRINFADAQQKQTISHTIGFPQGGATPASLVDAFRRGLRELGYVDRQNILIHYRRAEGKLDEIPALVAELIQLKVDLIFTANTPSALAAKKATGSIPIVIVAASDPVEAGLVNNLAHPGGNVTGVTRFTTELSGKRLELLKEAFPKTSHVAVLWNPDSRGASLAFKETESAAHALGVQLQSLKVREATDFDKAFAAITNKRANAMLLLGDAITILHRAKILAFAATMKLPAIYDRPDDVDEGGLMFYGVNEPELFHHAASYVDKIFKGARPADLPIEQPKKFEFIVNLKTARQIGLTIPPNVLARANKVIR